MKEVKVMPRFKCDFCNRRSTKASMTQHEKVCFRNPNRFCDYCKNKGFTHECLLDGGREDPSYYQDVACPYCSKFDPKIKEEIESREALLVKPVIDITEVPF